MPMFRKADLLKTMLSAGALSVLLLVPVAQAQTGQPSTMGNMPSMSGSSGGSGAKAQATGTVVAVNPAQKKVTLDHTPIPAIGWPAMKMEFPAAGPADLSKVKPGDKVQFSLSGANGSYTVESISPAK